MDEGKDHLRQRRGNNKLGAPFLVEKRLWSRRKIKDIYNYVDVIKNYYNMCMC